MKELNKKEMHEIVGGAVFTSALLNAITKAITSIYGLGQSVGSTIRRLKTGKYCSVA